MVVHCPLTRIIYKIKLAKSILRLNNIRNYNGLVNYTLGFDTLESDEDMPYTNSPQDDFDNDSFEEEDMFEEDSDSEMDTFDSEVDLDSDFDDGWSDGDDLDSDFDDGWSDGDDLDSDFDDFDDSEDSDIFDAFDDEEY